MRMVRLNGPFGAGIRGSSMLRGGRRMSFVAFDIMWRDSSDLRALPLIERKEHLRSILPKRSRVICEALSVASAGTKLFAAVVERDLEGIVAKRRTDPYRSSARWWKILRANGGPGRAVRRSLTHADIKLSPAS
jgi:ATP-dependent DNA ligase